MCLFLLLLAVGALILFGVPLFVVFFGISFVATALDKKRHGDEEPQSKEEREKRVAVQLAISAVILLGLFLGGLVVRYYMT